MRIAHQARYSRDTRVTRQIFTSSDAGARQVVSQLISRFGEARATLTCEKCPPAIRHLIVDGYARDPSLRSRITPLRSEVMSRDTFDYYRFILDIVSPESTREQI